MAALISSSYFDKILIREYPTLYLSIMKKGEKTREILVKIGLSFG